MAHHPDLTPHSQLCYTAFHANKENSHLITQKSSNFSSQESFGSLGNFVSLKEGGIKTAHVGGQEHAQEKED